MICPSALLVLLFLSLTAAEQIEETPCPPCENGSECVIIFTQSNDAVGYRSYSYCDCETTSMLTAGEYCEYFASSVCNNAGLVLGRDFCTNDGACATLG